MESSDCKHFWFAINTEDSDPITLTKSATKHIVVTLVCRKCKTYKQERYKPLGEVAESG